MNVKKKAVLASSMGPLSDLDIRLLRVFKAVVECGGMTAAELELNIGGPTISRHLKDLETRLGLTLCRRGRAGFAVTPEGDRIYQETLRLLTAIDGFRAGVDDIHQRMGGQLSIAIFDKTASNPACRISEAIALFAERAPEVGLELHVAPLNTIERGVIDGQFQVGIIPAHRASESLSYLDLFDETMLLYCAPGHPWWDIARQDARKVTNKGARLPGWNELKAQRFAGLGYHSPNMDLAHGHRIVRAATGFDQESIATLILSGRYLGFLPDHYAEAFVRSGRLVAVNPRVLRYPAHFVGVLRRSPPASRATRLLVDCLTETHGPITGAKP